MDQSLVASEQGNQFRCQLLVEGVKELINEERWRMRSLYLEFGDTSPTV